MEASYRFEIYEVWNNILQQILLLKWEDVFETVKTLPEEIREHVQYPVELVYECVGPPEDIKCEGEEREEIIKNIISEINRFCKLQIAMRELNGWNEVNRMIRQAPNCPREGKIVISRCCPSCKKIERNYHSCNKCRTSKWLEIELAMYDYDPEYIYFVKRVCKACKTWKIQNETSAAA